MRKRDWNIVLLLLAFLIAIMLWHPIWALIQLALFLVVVFVVYNLLKDRL